MDKNQIVELVEKYEKVFKITGIHPEEIDHNLQMPGIHQATCNAAWMLKRVKEYADSDLEKANRWLRFVQHVMWIAGYFNLEDMKKHIDNTYEREPVHTCNNKNCHKH
jgi:hypothetical protein